MDTARFCKGLTRWAANAAVVLSACFAGGCKSGTWGAKPSWWTFGGSGQDPSKLASAPAYEGGIPKPSATAKPYPTTTTPDGYVLSEQQRAGQSAASGAPSSAIEPTTVTYGAKPAADPAPSTTAAAPTATPGLSAVTTQVGPYGSLPGESQQPAMAAIPPQAAQPAPIAPNSQLPPAGSQGFASAPAAGPTARVADARATDNWPATAAPTDSRYGATTGSRFSNAAPAQPPADFPAATPISTQPITVPPAQVPITVPPPQAPFATPAPQTPAAMPPPLDSAPVAPPASQPLPAAAGSRRPDPGYRPGGTSSYRPSRAIFAGDAPPADSAVQPASFQAGVDQAP